MLNTTKSNILKSSDIASTCSYIDDHREDRRIHALVRLYLRRPCNSQLYSKLVKAIDISANGLLILSNVDLEKGAELEVSTFDRQIVVKAIVRHSTKDRSGKYRIGLEIISKNSSWFVPNMARINRLKPKFLDFNSKAVL